MKRIFNALGAFALTLALALTLAAAPLCPVVQAAEIEGDYAGYLVVLDTNAPAAISADPMAQATLMAAYDEREELLPLAQSAGVYMTDNLARIQNLVWSGQVLSTEPNYAAELFATPDLDTDHDDPTKPDDPFFIDQDYDYQFNLKDEFGIAARAAWDAGLTGEGVTIAVIDTGLYDYHVDTPAKVARGRYYFYRETPTGRYEFIVNGEPRRYNYYSNNDTLDTMGHGTMVAGIIAAKKDNGAAITGIAPNVTLMPLRCFTNVEGELGGHVANLVSGITYAMENGAQIISMSWGIKNDSAALKTVIDQAANKGCILFAAVGNDGTATVQYPAAWENVIGVGSTDKQGFLSDFSQRNQSVSVCAPGGRNGGNQIWSLGIKSEAAISKGDGTSFACPMVAACAALLKEADPSMTQADFLALLQGNCDPVLFRPGDDAAHAGLGRINLKKLLDATGYAGATLSHDGDSLVLRAAYHPVQSAAAPADPSALLMVGAYNAQGHLLDSQIAAPTLSGYGAYSLSARFDHPDATTLRAFYLKNDATLTTVAPSVARTAR